MSYPCRMLKGRTEVRSGPFVRRRWLSIRIPFCFACSMGRKPSLLKSRPDSQFIAAEFAIGPDSNRMAYRLEGPRLDLLTREMISEATPTGAIQVLPNGEALLLMADRQTVGGYPKIAVLISADLPKAAQLCPGHRVRFQTVSLAEAHQALVQQERRLLGVVGAKLT